MHTRLLLLLLVVLLAASVSACGPSETAHDAPPAAPGTAALRLAGHPDFAYTAAPYACGTAAGDPHTPGHVRCSIAHLEASGVATDGIDFNLEFPDGFTTQPAGTVLRVRHDVQLSEFGYSFGGSAFGGNDATVDGSMTITLGPPATPRTATLDGAMSSDRLGDTTMSVTFASLPITLAE